MKKQDLTGLYLENVMEALETWEDIPGYPAYKLNADGRIYSKSRNRLLKHHVTPIGYCQVFLTSAQSLGRWFRIHRLIAETFIPNTQNNREVNHKNGNKLDNRISNLEWVSHRDNIQHSFDKLGKVSISGMAGKKHTQKAKIKMSEKKIGINHPKFKGWYVLPDGSKHASARLAAEHWSGVTGFIISRVDISRWCKKVLKKPVPDFSFLNSEI